MFPKEKKPMTASEMGKLGAAKTNSILTTADRKRAAKKGWVKRRANKKI